MKKSFLLFLIVLPLLCACAAPLSEPSATPAATAFNVPHSFPESLEEFEARENHWESADFSQAASVVLRVNHCEYGEEPRRFTEADTVAALVEALQGITVTGGGDGISSTGTYYAYALYDAQEEYLGGVSIQDGMVISAGEGRCPISGLDALRAATPAEPAE